MQETYENKLNKLIAVILIITLTATNVLIVGINFVSYAIDMVATNSNNVEFEAYFKKNASGEKVKSLEENINDESINLYVDISVLREGYFNGKITLENSNFSIVGSTQNSYINNIDGNTVNLNQISSGSTVTIELQVKPSVDTNLNVDILDEQSEVKLTGTYVSSKDEKEILGTTNVELKLISSPKIVAGINAKMLTNKTYTINGKNKRVVQVLIKSKLLDDVYPIKNTNIEVSVPKDAENVEVYARSTNATNSNIKFGENNYQYDANKGILNIVLENNKDENGNINYNKHSTDELVVTYIYDENKTFESLQDNVAQDANKENEAEAQDKTDSKITVNSKITTWDDKELLANTAITINEEIDGVINYELKESEKELYKGKIYSGEERNYQTIARAYVNNIEANKNIELILKESTYVAQDVEKASNIEYKETKISKDEFTKVLGENGYITIKDNNGNTIENITNQTQVDAQGNIVVKYQEGVKGLIITTSTPIAKGKIDFTTARAILKGEYTREEIKTFTAIKDKITANGKDQEIKIELKETSTKAELDVSTTTLSTEKINENVLIKTTLLTNDESKDLYKNPKIKITFPSKVTDVDAKYKILYANGLEIKSSILKEENGRKVLEMQLAGEQTTYPGDSIDGTVIMVSANLTVDKIATSSKEAITLTYTNENAISYESKESADSIESLASLMSLESANEENIASEEVLKEGTETESIDIVQQSSFIVTNDVKAFDVATIGKEEDKTIELQATSEDRVATVEISAINNEGEDLQDVKILGKFPTKNVANTMDITLKSGINVTSNSENVKVYYSAKENPTEDLANSENGWSESSNLEGMNSYLIVISSMANGAKFTANYEVTIPKTIAKNQVAVESFEAKYKKANGEEKTASSTKVVFSTNNADALDMKLQATVGGDTLKDGDEVKQGEVIKYTISLKNTGSKDIANITVTGNVPEGTSLYVTQDANEKESQPEGTTKVFENVSIKQGETVSLSYQVKVNEDIAEGTLIEGMVSTSYDDVTEKMTSVTKASDIVLELMVDGRLGKSTINSGFNYGYVLKITNTSDEDKENINIKLISNSLLEINTTNSNAIKADKTISIDSLSAKKTYWISFTANVKDLDNSDKYTTIYSTATCGDTVYRTNTVEEEIARFDFDIKLRSSSTANNTTKIVRVGDTITYTININNLGDYDANELLIKDKISDYLEVQKVLVNNQEVNYYMMNEYNDNYRDLTVQTRLETGASTQIIIETKVNKTELKDSVKITNMVKVFNGVKYICETQEEIYYIEPSEDEPDTPNVPETPGTPDDVDEPDAPNTPDSPNDSENIDKKNTFRVDGKVWIDKDENGNSTSDEELLSGVKVSLVDTETSKIMTDSDGKRITAETDKGGKYVLSNIPSGKYVVIFEYDTSKYKPTTYQKEGVSTISNSDAILKEMVIEGENKKIAATDILAVNEDVLNVDLGLVEMKDFDLELSKYVNKIVVTNSEGTKTYEFNEATLAKVEIAAKNLNGSKVLIEYTIKVKNTGEISGYVKNIVDYMSQELEFSSSLNGDWYKQGEYLYNTSLANTELKSGETKELKLILTKTMTESNTGLIGNTAEIAETNNTSGVLDIDSTPNNRNNGEDDMGQADVIISVKTGTLISYIMLILSILTIIGGGVYLINKEILKGNIDF